MEPTSENIAKLFLGQAEARYRHLYEQDGRNVHFLKLLREYRKWKVEPPAWLVAFWLDALVTVDEAESPAKIAKQLGLTEAKQAAKAERRLAAVQMVDGLEKKRANVEASLRSLLELNENEEHKFTELSVSERRKMVQQLRKDLRQIKRRKGDTIATAADDDIVKIVADHCRLEVNYLTNLLKPSRKK